MHDRVTEQAALRYRLSGFDRDQIDSTSHRTWGACTRCGLSRTRTRVALKRRGGQGRIRLLLIGEAPGQFEDALGVPFVGHSGRILDKTIEYTVHSFHAPFSYLITNTVCCRPQTIEYLSTEIEDSPLEELHYGEDYEIYDYNRDPSPQEMAACRPHIDELVEDYSPHGIVYVGKVAKSYLTRLPTVELLHPAYIARLEAKLQTVLKEATKLSRFIHRLNHEVPYDS